MSRFLMTFPITCESCKADLTGIVEDILIHRRWIKENGEWIQDETIKNNETSYYCATCGADIIPSWVWK